MLVKNTIIALMAVAPALSIPIAATVKSASTVATTKATVGTKANAANPTAQKVSKASVTKAESNVDRDVATERKLKAQLKAADSRLVTDATSARKLEKAESAQGAADKAARKAALKTTGLSKTHKTPGSKLSTKLSTKSTKTKTSNKSLVAEERLARKQSLHHHSTSHVESKHHSKTNALSGEGIHRNKHNLRIDTTGRTHGLATPGSARTSKLTGQSVTTPGSARTGFPNALGTGQSQYGFSGPQTGFQSPPVSGRFSRMTEDIDYTPTTGGGYKESISWGQPGSAKRLARRALTPTTPVSAPLSPLAALIQKARKSTKVHQHTIAEVMQLSELLIEAEKVVNGLEGQLNKPQTVFHNLKRKSALKRLTVPKTPVTPATPSAVKST